MNHQDIRKIMAEFSKIKPEAGSDDAALLEVALFVENSFGLTLTDEEICQKNLGTHQETEQFVLHKLEAI